VKLIEEIKKAEEKAEQLRKDAEKQGQGLLDVEQEKNKQALANLAHEKEDLFKVKLAEAKVEAEKEIAKLRTKLKQEIQKIEESYKKNNEKAVKQVQKIILQWPSSQ
jgi:V/A-type H+-transporting ATPase subunit G/H